jgi:hypothetical protein
MRRLGIEGVSRRGKRPQTTRQAREAPAAEDLVRRRFRASEPNRLWSPTSPTCRRGRDICSWRRSSTPGAVAVSAGRCATTCAQSSCSTRSRWPSCAASPPPASSTTQTRARNPHSTGPRNSVSVR